MEGGKSLSCADIKKEEEERREQKEKGGR